MLLGFKTELKVNNWQRTQLSKHCGVARHAWNWGLALTKQILDHNQAHPHDKIKFPSARDLHNWLIAMVKPDCPWYDEVSKYTPEYALRHLRAAWRQTFKKLQKPPRFKKKGKSDSFTVDGAVNLTQFAVQLPTNGWVKTHEPLPVKYQPKSLTVSRTADRWFVSWIIDIDPVNRPKAVAVVGVDLGVKVLATWSTKSLLEGAKNYHKYEQQLARLQWLNRHKQIGSANWRKAQIKITKLHRKIANICKDTLHKLTSYLAKNHGKNEIEDLNVSVTMANLQLAKAIGDRGFYEFRRQLEYKCQLYRSQLVVVDQWFPSSKAGSNCGTQKEILSLSARVFKSDNCGLEIDRDLNASINFNLEQAVS